MLQSRDFKQKIQIGFISLLIGWYNRRIKGISDLGANAQTGFVLRVYEKERDEKAIEIVQAHEHVRYLLRTNECLCSSTLKNVRVAPSQPVVAVDPTLSVTLHVVNAHPPSLATQSSATFTWKVNICC